MQCLCHDPSTSSVHASVHYWCHDLQKQQVFATPNAVMVSWPVNKIKRPWFNTLPLSWLLKHEQVSMAQCSVCVMTPQHQVPMLQYTTGITTFKKQQVFATPNAVIVSWPVNKIKRPWFITLPLSWPVNISKCSWLNALLVSRLINNIKCPCFYTLPSKNRKCSQLLIQ